MMYRPTLLSLIAIPIASVALVQPSEARDRYVNQSRIEARTAHMIESVQVLDTPPTDGSYEVLQTIRGTDAFTKKDAHIINLIRYEAAKIKANALINVHCKTEYKYMKTCTAKAIRFK